jgi:YggT family protein
VNEVLNFIDTLYSIYGWMIFIYVMMSWLPAVRQSFVGEILARLVEPYLRPFRRIIPPIGGILDLSPFVALLALYFIVRGLKTVLLGFPW